MDTVLKYITIVGVPLCLSKLVLVCRKIATSCLAYFLNT